jgi:DNA-binding NarL/FixJ family response regulator
MLDLTRYPIRILGGGLTFNTLGLLAGSGIGNFISIMRYDSVYLSAIALGVVFLVLILMPPLLKQLTEVLKNHINLDQFSKLPVEEQTNVIKKTMMIDHLTERESEIADLLMRGRTYKMISTELFLSENTVKTHIKNIYSKLQVRNKTELINIFMEQYSKE